MGLSLRGPPGWAVLRASGKGRNLGSAQESSLELNAASPGAGGRTWDLQSERGWLVASEVGSAPDSGAGGQAAGPPPPPGGAPGLREWWGWDREGWACPHSLLADCCLLEWECGIVAVKISL